MGYEQLLIWQYADQPRALATMKGLSDQGQYLINSAKELMDVLDLDTAVGVNLDLIGKHLGVSRLVPNIISEYFGFEGIGLPFSKGFQGGGRFMNRGRSKPNFAKVPDFFYRRMLKVKIIKDYSKGNCRDIETAVRTLFPDCECCVFDNYDMTATIDVYPKPDTFQLAIMWKTDILPRPHGVDFVYKYGGNVKYFGFEGQPAVSIFGETGTGVGKPFFEDN